MMASVMNTSAVHGASASNISTLSATDTTNGHPPRHPVRPLQRVARVSSPSEFLEGAGEARILGHDLALHLVQ
jgi:hypothetical protein